MGASRLLVAALFMCGEAEAFLRHHVGIGRPTHHQHGRASVEAGRLLGLHGERRAEAAKTTLYATLQSPQQPPAPWQPYVDVLRPQNIPAAFILVGIGAIAATHNPAILAEPRVGLTALAAALVAVGSCVLNDILDEELDRINKPTRPLVTGAVPRSHATAIAAACLGGALISAFMVHPAALQWVIWGSVGLVSAYTTLLKPVPLLKNAVAAGVIAASIAAGGLAAGADMQSVLGPVLITFVGTVHREVLMDISDVEGDAAANIKTLPVLLGRRGALAVATAILAIGTGAVATSLFNGCSHAWAGALLLATLPAFSASLELDRAKFDPNILSGAIDKEFLPLAMSLAVLGFAGPSAAGL